ncbi:hypothetical protein FSP39_024027, partial [Pinctada imbricata]
SCKCLLYIGLSAAKVIHESGSDVLVLEARTRVGGRTYTKRNETVTYVDMGGAYVGPTQNSLLRLADELGIKTYPTYEKEDWLFYSRGLSVRFQGAFPPLSGFFSKLDMNNLFRLIDKMGEEIPPHAPWEAPHAEEWDKMTVKEFYNKHVWTRDTMKQGEQFVQVNVTSESYEASLLWFLWYVRLCGGSDRINATDNGGQERKFVGGSQQISERIADRLGQDRVLLDHAVCGIKQDDQLVQVSCYNGKVFKCRHVILAIPLPLQNRIVYDPPLPPLRNQLIQRIPMGSVIKTFVYYDKPFWREKGYCGSVVIDDDEALAEFTSDECKVDGSKPAIMGFILANRARKYVSLTREERRDRLCEMYAKVFQTDQALKYVHYEEMNWLEEQWSGGCYTVMMPPGFLTTFGRELRKPVGRIYFAGTETATQWSGYMEGAVQAGQRAAREILFARGKIEESDIWQKAPEHDIVKPRPFDKSMFERHAPSVGGFLKAVGSVSVCIACATFILYRKFRK